MKYVCIILLIFLIKINLVSQNCDVVCQNLAKNTNFELNSTNSVNLQGAISNGFVDDWATGLNIPHLIYIRPDGSCFWGGYNPATENEDLMTCLSSRWDPSLTIERGYAESIYQEFTFVSNPYITYEVCVDAKNLACGAIADNSHLRIRAINDIVINWPVFYESVPPVLPGTDFQIIGEEIVNSFNYETFTFSFNPNSSFSNLEIINAVESQAVTFLAIDNVNVKCENSGLAGINSDITDMTSNFTAIYDAIGVDIVEYNWTFGDDNSSNDASPSQTYAEYDSYNVCLEITDEFGCCAKFCNDIEIVSPSFSCPIDENTLVIDATDDLTNSFSDLVIAGQFNSGGTLFGKDIVIKGKFLLDENFTFYDCNFYFEPGAELEVRSPGYIRIVNSDLIGCSEMWKGISVYGTSPENVFSFGNNYISDAFRGLSILEGSNIQQFKNTFDSNYTGIYSPRNNGVMKTHYGSSITRSTFISEKEMLPKYLGQPGWQEVTRYGIHVYDLDHLIVTDFNSQLGGPGPTPTYRNRFERIQNGISYDNVNMRIKGNEFKNFQLNNSGWAIIGENCNTSSVSNNEFLNVNYTLNLKNSVNAKVAIISNKIIEDDEAVSVPSGQVARRINIYNIHSSEFLIYYNELSQEKILGSGISLFSCNSSKKVNIVGNSFRSQPRNLGLFLSNVHKVVGAEGIISFNHTFIGPNENDMKTSINLQNTDNFIISNNNIKTNYPYSSPFSFRNSKRCLVEGNESTLNTSDINGSNYYVNISPGNIYCCNIANSGERGFYFRGENKDTELRSSLIYNTEIGVLLYNAEIGKQDLYGNYWENGSTDTKARYIDNLGSPDSYQASPFTVNPGGQPGTRPMTVIPIEWFENVNGQATLCPDNNSDETCGSPNWDGFNFTGSIPNGDLCEFFKDELITLVGPEVYWHFQNQNDWVFYSYVFDNYKDIPLEFWSDCFPIPEKEVNVKTVAEFYHTDKTYKEAYKTTESENIQFNSLQSTLDNNLEELNNILENVETEEDYENNKTVIINLQNQIYQVSIDMGTINHAITLRGESTLQNLVSRINSLPSDFYFLNELKYVWNIKTQIDLFLIESVTTSQWSEIERIANECVLEYGAAVFEAQSLMNLIGVTNFDNEASCESIRPRKSLSNDRFINVYPNPSNGIYTIELSNEPSGLESINVYDINGTVVLAKEIKDRDSKLSFDISDKKSGIYYLKVVRKDGLTYQKKLILIK